MNQTISQIPPSSMILLEFKNITVNFSECFPNYNLKVTSQTRALLSYYFDAYLSQTFFSFNDLHIIISPSRMQLQKNRDFTVFISNLKASQRTQQTPSTCSLKKKHSWKTNNALLPNMKGKIQMEHCWACAGHSFPNNEFSNILCTPSQY